MLIAISPRLAWDARDSGSRTWNEVGFPTKLRYTFPSVNIELRGNLLKCDCWQLLRTGKSSRRKKSDPSRPISFLLSPAYLSNASVRMWKRCVAPIFVFHLNLQSCVVGQGPTIFVVSFVLLSANANQSDLSMLEPQPPSKLAHWIANLVPWKKSEGKWTIVGVYTFKASLTSPFLSHPHVSVYVIDYPLEDVSFRSSFFLVTIGRVYEILKYLFGSLSELHFSRAAYLICAPNWAGLWWFCFRSSGFPSSFQSKHRSRDGVLKVLIGWARWIKMNSLLSRSSCYADSGFCLFANPIVSLMARYSQDY